MPCCATVDLGNLLCRQPESAVLLGGKAKPVLLHRCQNAEISLYSTGIVVVDVALDHLNKFLFAGKSSAVIAFTFQDTPKSFHWAIVNTMAHTGHTLCHPGLLQFVMKSSAGILVTSVAMKQGCASGLARTALSKVL